MRSGQYCQPRTEYSPILPSQSCSNIYLFQIPVTVTWNGTLVTGPILIYHDELRLDGNNNPMLGDLDGPGALVCRSQTQEGAFWRNTAGETIPATDEPGGLPNDINVIRNGPTDVPSFSRLSRGTTTSPAGNLFDGLLLCRVFHFNVPDVIANYRYVGLYNRQRSGKCHTIQLSKIIRSYVHCRSWCNHNRQCGYCGHEFNISRQPPRVSSSC